VQRFGPLLEQLDDGRIEADGDRTIDLEDEPGPGRRPAPALPGPVAVPRAVHAQVRAQLEAAIEADEQVLALGIHALDALADKALDLGHRARPLCPGGLHDPAVEVGPQSGRGPCEGVAFGHG
jgi:hypothetical protein